MTLPASGPISLTQIAAEFGLPANSAFPAAFYGKGGAPASGPLSFADFYGRSAFTLSKAPSSIAVSGFSQSQTCVVTSTIGTTFTFSGTTVRCTASQTDSTHASVTVTTPAGGNGSVSGTVRVTASNGDFLDVDFNADWGSS